MDLDQLTRFMRPLQRRVMSMVRRASINGSSDGGPLQTLQIETLKDVVQDGVERVGEYGFSSRPKAGAEALVVYLGGNGDHGVIIATDDSRFRIRALEEGEVAIYTDEGDKIHLKRGRVIDIVTGTLNIKAATKVSIETPTLETSAILKVGTSITAKALNADTVADAKGTMDKIRETYNIHTHPETGQATQVPSQPMT